MKFILGMERHKYLGGKKEISNRDAPNNKTDWDPAFSKNLRPQKHCKY